MKIQLDNGMVLFIDEYYELEAKAKGILEQFRKDFPSIAGTAMEKAIREHISEKYPGSEHWDPNRVNAQSDGTVDVDIPGASRAYHDIDIYPINAEHLTIPLHPDAYGTKVSDWNNTFRPKGKDIIAQVQNGSLVALFALCKHVHQNQDSTLMPDDTELAVAVNAGVEAYLNG